MPAENMPDRPTATRHTAPSAIELARQQYYAKPDGTDRRAEWDVLRPMLMRLWTATSSREYLEEIIQNDIESLRITPCNGREVQQYADRLGSLSLAMNQLFVQTETLSTAAKALFYGRYCLELQSPERVASIALMRSHVAMLLSAMSNLKFDINYLDEAREQAEIAASVPLVNGSVRSRILQNLGIILGRRYRRLQSKDVEQLKRAIWATEEALKSAAPEQDVSGIHQDLGCSMSLLFDVSGDALHLERAIRESQRSIEKTVIDPELFADRSSILATNLIERFLCFGAWDDADAALKVLQEAVQRLPVGSTRRHKLQTDFLEFSSARYKRSNRLSDLDSGIATAEEATRHPSSSWRSNLRLYHELGSAYTSRFARSSDPRDSSKAISYCEMAIEVTPMDDPTHCELLMALSNIYYRMYINTKQSEHLKVAIAIAERSLRAGQTETTLLNAAHKHLRLYLLDKSRYLNSLDTAASHANAALDVTIGTHNQHRAQILISSGLIYQCKADEIKYGVAQNSKDRSTALNLFVNCYSLLEAPLMLRVTAARRASHILYSLSRYEEAWEFLSKAIQWIPLLFPGHLSSSDQQNIVSQLSGLASEACACAIACGKVGDALEALEQGRGILIASSHRALDELEKLEREQPDLFRKYSLRRSALIHQDASGDSDGNHASIMSSFPTLPHNVFEKAKSDMDEVIEEIRQVPGFEQFLLPMNCSDMQSLIETGTVVVLNATRLRNDAILVTKDSLRSIQLQNPEALPGLMELLPTAMGKTINDAAHGNLKTKLDRRKENSVLSGMLAWLWQHIAEPVMAALDLTKEAMTKDPTQCRVFWMATGSYARLPIHAAGLYVGKCLDSVPKRAVSSYIASFRMLRYARSRSGRLDSRSDNNSALLLSMARPKNVKSNLYLKNAPRLKKKIIAAASNLKWTTIKRPSGELLLSNLSDYSWLHVACHAVTDQKDPSNSHLLLQGGSRVVSLEKPTPDLLTVRRITNKRTQIGLLAFLTACSTADTRVESLIDEGLSIGNAFQIAGFPHVIGSMWPAVERIAEEYAEAFYGFLASWKGSETSRDDLIACAANFATMNLMKEYLKEPFLWAGYIHLGP